MPPRLIPLAVLLGATTALAEEPPAPGWREALAVEFESAPQPVVAPTLESSPLRPGVPMPEFVDDDPDLVPLPAMTISARRTYRDLDKGIAENYRRLKAEELNGMGGLLYKKDIGPVRFGVYSVLYIPVAIRFSW